MNPQQSASELEEAAVRWIWRLDREGANEQLEDELEQWLASDSRRRGAFLQAQATWGLLEGRHSSNAQARGGRRWALASAASVAVLAAAILWIMESPLSGEHYRTSIGEIRQVPLSDGSTAAINTHSTVEVSMKPERRVVRLVDGEAWFRVSKDPARPFIVEVGRVRVRALGTAFAVRKHEHGADVVVTDGTIETWVAGAEGHTVRVAAGGAAFVSENAAISSRTGPHVQVDRILAWRAGRIDLSGESLAEAVEEFNRYNRRKLIIASADLLPERLYGVFRTDDPEGFAYAVSRSLGATVLLPNPDEIQLARE